MKRNFTPAFRVVKKVFHHSCACNVHNCKGANCKSARNCRGKMVKVGKRWVCTKHFKEINQIKFY